MVTIGAVIPIILLIRSGFELVGLVLSSMGLVLSSLGFITFPNVVFCLLFHIFGLFMFSLMVIGFAVDTIEVKEVEEAAVMIGWLCQLGLGLGVERGDVEQAVRVF